MKKRLALLLALMMTLTACHAPEAPPASEDLPPEPEQTVVTDIPFQLLSMISTACTPFWQKTGPILPCPACFTSRCLS